MTKYPLAQGISLALLNSTKDSDRASRDTRYATGIGWLLIAILLCGFFLRVHALSDISFNPDEARAVDSFIRAPAVNIVTTYHTANHIFSSLLSHLAISQLGENLFILRWPSALLGLLAIAATGRIARSLFDREVAVVSVCLAAFSVFQIDYSQQVRGYTGLVFFATMSFYFLWAGLESNRWSMWVGFAVSGAMAVYTHLFGGLALGACLVITIAWIVRRRLRGGNLEWRRTTLRAVSSFLLLALLILLTLGPVIPQILQVPEQEHRYNSEIPPLTSAQSPLEAVSPYVNLLRVLSSNVPGWAMVAYIMLAVIGVIASARRAEWRTIGFLGAWLVLPLVFSMVGLEAIEGFYVRFRFWIFLLPPYLVFVSRGMLALMHILARQVVWLRPRIALLTGLIFVLAGVHLPLLREYYGTRASGDWFRASQYLASVVRPNDLVACEPYNHGWKAVDLDPADDCTRSIAYHLDRNVPRLYPVMSLHTLTYLDYITQYPVVAVRDVPVWIVVWGIDNPSALGWAKENAAFVSNRFGNTAVIGPISYGVLVDNLIGALVDLLETAPSDSERFAYLVRLAGLYAITGRDEKAEETLALASAIPITHPEAEQELREVEQALGHPPLVLVPDHSMNVNLGQSVRFGGYSLSSARVAPNGTLKLTLFWEAIAPIQENYTIFLHLRDGENRTVVQQDFQPVTPTSSWQQGDKVYEPRELFIPPDTPLGEYRLRVGMYLVDTLERLSVSSDATGENAIELSKIEVGW